MVGVAVRLLCAALVGAALGGCARSPAPDPGLGIAPSGWTTYHLDQRWDEPPGWRIAVTGIRCGATASLAPGDTDADRVCLVSVTYTNTGTATIPFTGTVDDPGPTWRVTGFAADGAEFHGHALPVGPTAPGASGSDDLLFEVPPGPPLRRVLLARGMVVLT